MRRGKEEKKVEEGLSKPEQDILTLVTNIGLSTGANLVTSRVYAIVFSEPRPVPLDELCDRTGYSLSTVSGAVKSLERIRKVERVRLPGSKKVYVQSDKNMIRSLHQQFKDIIELKIAPFEEELPYIIKELKTTVENAQKERREAIAQKIMLYEEYLKQFIAFKGIIASMGSMLDECKHRPWREKDSQA